MLDDMRFADRPKNKNEKQRKISRHHAAQLEDLHLETCRVRFIGSKTDFFFLVATQFSQ